MSFVHENANNMQSSISSLVPHISQVRRVSRHELLSSQSEKISRCTTQEIHRRSYSHVSVTHVRKYEPHSARNNLMNRREIKSGFSMTPNHVTIRSIRKSNTAFTLHNSTTNFLERELSFSIANHTDTRSADRFELHSARSLSSSLRSATIDEIEFSPRNSVDFEDMPVSRLLIECPNISVTHLDDTKQPSNQQSQ